MIKLTEKMVEVPIKRKVIETRAEWFDITDYTLSEAINHLNELSQKYGADAMITQPYEDNEGFYIQTLREETDEEYRRRIHVEKLQEAADRQLYEQLKKRFDNSN